MQLLVPASLDSGDGPLVAAIRPENIVVHEQPTPGAFAAEVDVVQPTGSQTIISTIMGGKRITVLIPRFEPSIRSKTVWLEFPAGQVCYFNARDGRRIPERSRVAASANAA